MTMMVSLKTMIMEVIKAKRATKELLLQIQITLILMRHLKQVIQVKELEELAPNQRIMEEPPMTKLTRSNALSARFSMI
jgi:hypothetical protein